MPAQATLQRWFHRPTRQIILCFLVLDLIAAACFYLHHREWLSSSFFRPNRDRGLFELIEYGKFVAIISLLWLCWKNCGSKLMRAWTLLFMVMLVDNACELHERLGGLLAAHVALPDIGLSRPKDLAEILVMAALEGSALLFVIAQYFRSDQRFKRFSRALIGLVLAIGLASVISDALHLALLEEPIEIIGVTVLLAFIHFRYRGFATEFAPGPAMYQDPPTALGASVEDPERRVACSQMATNLPSSKTIETAESRRGSQHR